MIFFFQMEVLGENKDVDLDLVKDEAVEDYEEHLKLKIQETHEKV